MSIIRAVEERGSLSIFEKIRSWLDEIFRYASVTEGQEVNPAADLNIALMSHRCNNCYPFLMTEGLPELLAKLPHYRGNRQTILGLKLILLTGVRPSELCFSEQWQFDLKNIPWNIPAVDVKQLQKIYQQVDNRVPDYIVPL